MSHEKSEKNIKEDNQISKPLKDIVTIISTYTSLHVFHIIIILYLYPYLAGWQPGPVKLHQYHIFDFWFPISVATPQLGVADYQIILFPIHIYLSHENCM